MTPPATSAAACADPSWREVRAAAGSCCDGRCGRALDAERCRVLTLLRRHGRHATSFQVLGPDFAYWFDQDASAAVAYAEVGRYRVVAGPPIAPLEERAAVAARFVGASRAARRRVLFFSVGQDFVDELRAAPPQGGLDVLPIGVQAEFDPADYGLAGRERRSMRAQVNRARNHGVRVRRVSVEQLEAQTSLRAQVETVLARWLAARRMGVMRFLVDVHPFVAAPERRFYLAERQGHAVGFLAAAPVYARGGWFLEDVIRAPDAPNGTNEALIHAALDEGREDGALYATLGLAPLAELPTGPGPHRLLRWALRGAYRWLGALYGFRGLYAFKSRTRPDRWTRQNLVACPPKAGVGALVAVLRAFAGQGLVTYVRDSAARAWASGFCSPGGDHLLRGAHVDADAAPR
jgi:phosphatidylglycerol lysyltransferase